MSAGVGSRKGTSLALIAAVDRRGGIGLRNELLWRHSADQQHFKQATLGHPVIMGRKTWDSLPPRFRPLPGRTNIVVTRQADWQAEGAHRAGSLSEALALCDGGKTVWIIGGAQIYAEALALADCVEVTEIAQDFDGDAYAPVLGAEWVETAREHHVSTNGLPFSFVTRVRRS